MTNAQEAHLRRIIDGFTARCDSKYRDGQKYHGGNLFAMGAMKLLDNAIDEAIDQVTYLLTLRDRLAEGVPSPKATDGP